MSVIDLNELEKGGLNAPVNEILDPAVFLPSFEPGASRYRFTYENGYHLDSLLVYKESDILVVSFHGALVRASTALPRFERLATFSSKPVNSLYIADPGLWANEKVTLTWFTGWKDSDVVSDIANLIQVAREATGATHVILTGGSGGGFASLQIASKIPGSLAMVFDPQTTIYKYQGLTDRTRWFFHRSYLRAMYPEFAENNFKDIDFFEDWTKPFGKRMSAIETYSDPVSNKVLYTSNLNDSHHERHFLPFMEVVSGNENKNKITTEIWESPKGPVPVSKTQMDKTFDLALDLVRSR